MKSKFKDRVIYQIYPRSFKDSNNDGIGDLKGIISSLDYLADLGINCIWLSPVYKSPNDDNGYDISDYKDINPEFGTMAEMDELIYKAKQKGISLLMDLVINHTSDEHPWFIASQRGEIPYEDYYFWEKSDSNKLPNNWTSFFGEKAWSYDEYKKQYYLHLFSKKQPDLNYHNPKVLEEIKDIMRFWLDKGIEGFRCDVINIIWKSSLQNGKPSLILTGKEHYLSTDGMHDILVKLRNDVLNSYECFTVGETVFVTPKQAQRLCSKESVDNPKELDMIFSFEHMECDQIIVKWFKTKFRPKKFFKALDKWQNVLSWNANYFENHDQPRSISRFVKEDRYHDQGAKTLGLLLFFLRGTPFVYQGQEIGMTNFDFTHLHQIRDVESHNIFKLAKRLHFPQWYIWKMLKSTSRDNSRTPMQWSTRENAGFSSSSPWIKVNGNFKNINAKSQVADINSTLSFYKSLITLRKSIPVLIDGRYRKIKISSTLFVFERYLEDSKNEQSINKLRVIVNLSKNTSKYDYYGKILISTHDRTNYDGTLSAYESIVLY